MENKEHFAKFIGIFTMKREEIIDYLTINGSYDHLRLMFTMSEKNGYNIEKLFHYKILPINLLVTNELYSIINNLIRHWNIKTIIEINSGSEILTKRLNKSNSKITFHNQINDIKYNNKDLLIISWPDRKLFKDLLELIKNNDLTRFIVIGGDLDNDIPDSNFVETFEDMGYECKILAPKCISYVDTFVNNYTRFDLETKHKINNSTYTLLYIFNKDFSFTDNVLRILINTNDLTEFVEKDSMIPMSPLTPATSFEFNEN
jgi:hypothetical protein